MNLADVLVDHPFADDEPLLCTLTRSVTAGEVKAAATALSQSLRDSGVGAGQAVAVQLPNGPEAVMAMVGVWMAGAVFVPLNVRQTVSEVTAALESTGAAAVLDERGVHLLSGQATRYDGDTAFVTWTSGTTGRPKPILQTHSGYFELIDRVLGALKGDPGRRPPPNLIPVSLALNAGIYNVLFGLRAGAAVVIMEHFDTVDFAELVRRFEIRSTVLPPAAMTMLADDDEVSDLSPLRYVRSITAPLSPLSARRFTEKFGVTVLNGYGQAEIGEVIGWTAADAREHPGKIGAVGKPHAGVEVRIEGGEEVGELLVRPPRMAAGLEDRLDADGFVHTGDVARIDAEGFVWIEGRLGDVINRGGNKVFPDHVEEVLRLSPNVHDVAVVGVPDERLGEVPVAFVVGSAGGHARPEDLETLCRRHLVAYKVPVAFRFVDALPRSEVGKVLRRQLAAQYAGAG
ncbi:MAG: AMP-dependent synthetase and ligase [Acidimicrobiales bacterium]|nr:AMP-dependent synthetase and ligase [Acidimicrobiales bacterium]